MSYTIDKSGPAQISFWKDLLSKPVFQRTEADIDRALLFLRTSNQVLRDCSDEVLETLTKHIALVEMSQGQKLETVQVHESRFLRPALDMMVVLDGRIQWSFPAPKRHTRVVGAVYTSGDIITGSKLFASVLPTGSSFVAEQRGTFALIVPEENIQNVVNDYDKKELQQRMAYLRTLTVPLVTSWTDPEVAELARSLIPLKLPSHTVVVREHEVSDALYFIRSGKLKVVREIDFSAGNHPNAKLLELATLCPGEYFGELGLLSRDVDAPKSATMTKAEIAALIKEPLLPSARTTSSFDGTQNRTSTVLSVTTTLTAGKNILPVDSSVVKTTTNEIGEVILATRPRQATVYAHTLVDLLVLPVEKFDQLFVTASTASRSHATVALLKMREYTLGYPTQNDIKGYFMKQKKWSDFKGNILSKNGNVTDESAKGLLGANFNAAVY